MSFEDSDGNRLSIPGEITITVPQEALGNTTNVEEVKVWTLNPTTGGWDFSGDLTQETDDDQSRRKKRQIAQGGWGQYSYRSTIRGLSISSRWFNFDSISRQTCVAKVRVFPYDSFTEQDQIHSATVSMVLQDSNGYNSLSQNRAYTDTYRNGFCMITPCLSHRMNTGQTFRGYVFAEIDGRPLTPVLGTEFDDTSPSADLTSRLNFEIIDDKIKVDFNEALIFREGIDGPFYDWQRKWRYSYTCSNAPFSANHFRFQQPYTCLLERDSYDVTPYYFWRNIPENTLLWFDFYSYQPWWSGSYLRYFYRYRTCYIKVLAPADTKVQAISYVADQNHHYYGTNRDIYGVRQDCATGGAVCLEVRPPGQPRSYYRDYTSRDETRTRVRLRTLDGEWNVSDVNALMMSSTLLRAGIVNSFEEPSQVFEVI